MDLCLFARPHLTPGGDVAGFLEVARMADRAGIHSICFGEHLIIGTDTTRYPYGPWVHDPATPWMDPLMTMASVASVTERLRLSTGIVLAPLRPGLVLAKEVATLDVLSGGRVELGLGTGWQAEEYLGVGLRWEDRQRRFDEVIETCRTAWGDQPFSLTTAEAGLHDLVALPRPVQDRVPLLYGVRVTPANARRIARLGDGWTPVAVSPQQVAEGVGMLRAEYENAGRDPHTLIVRVGLPPVVMADGSLDIAAGFAPAAAYVAAGANVLVVGFNHRLASFDQAAELLDGVLAAAAELG